MSAVPLELPNMGVTDVSYPIAEVTHRLLEAGDTTDLVLGDLPLDNVRKLEAMRRHLDRTRAQGGQG
jgi:hypothetical protein